MQGFKYTNFTGKEQSVSSPAQRSRLAARRHDDEHPQRIHSLLLLDKLGATVGAALKKLSVHSSCLQKKTLPEQPQPTWKTLT